MNKLHIVILLFILYANVPWEDTLCSLRDTAEAHINLGGILLVAVEMSWAPSMRFTLEAERERKKRFGWFIKTEGRKEGRTNLEYIP